MNRVWVVEMLCSHIKFSRWEPCHSVSTTKKKGLKELKSWKEADPDDSFRLTCYVPSDEKGK